MTKIKNTDNRLFSTLRILLALVMVFCAVNSCTVKDGNILNNDVAVGSISVTANVDSAQIFIDMQDTGHLSVKDSAVIIEDVTVGSHIVQLFKNGFRVDPGSSTVTVLEGQQATLIFQLEVIVVTGSMQVNSTPDSALVLVDGIPLGANPYTPLRLDGLSPGSYTIDIQKGSHRPEQQQVTILPDTVVTIEQSLTLTRMVLVEHFSNTGCIPCVESDSILERIFHEEGVASLISLGYHPDFPSPADPMFLEARDGNLARSNYYSVPGAPAVYVDGVIAFGGFELEQRMRNAMATRRAIPPSAILEIFDFQSNENNLSGTVKITALDNNIASGVVLRIAVIEREITYQQAPGINGQTYFFDVFRALNNSGSGTAVSLTTGETAFINFNFPREAFWSFDRLEVVAFLQNHSSKEVLQAAWSLYP